MSLTSTDPSLELISCPQNDNMDIVVISDDDDDIVDTPGVVPSTNIEGSSSLSPVIDDNELPHVDLGSNMSLNCAKINVPLNHTTVSKPLGPLYHNTSHHNVPSTSKLITMNTSEDMETDRMSLSSDDEPMQEVKSKSRQILMTNLFPSSKYANNKSTNINRSKKSEESELMDDMNIPSEPKPSFIKMIGGVKVDLPVDPYGCQVAVMSQVISGIKFNKNCMLESPTGTGKTLALLCASLAWQKQEKERLSDEKAKEYVSLHPDLNQLSGAAEFIASPIKKNPVQEPESFFTRKIHGEKSIYDEPKAGTSDFNHVNSLEEEFNNSWWEGENSKIYDEPKAGTSDLNHVNSLEEEFNNSWWEDNTNSGLVNIVNKKRIHSNEPPSIKQEVPSSPEKTIEITEKVTPQKTWELYNLVDNLRFRTNLIVNSSLPVIYYGARTHKQIEQVVKEFSRTAYCGDAVMTLLSSRDNSCIREFDEQQWKTRNDMCMGCTKLHSGPNKSTSNCKYYDNRKALNHRTLPPAFDLNVLVRVGEREMACPYYAARDMANGANIVFCPYNYLIEPSIRKSMNIELRNNIVIIDEAHNIEDNCREAASFSLTTQQLQDAIGEFNHLSSFRYANHEFMNYAEVLVQALKNWNQWFENQEPLINSQTVNGTKAEYAWQVEAFVQTLDNHNIGRAQYDQFHQSAESFCRRLRENPHTLVGITQATGTVVESIDTALGYLFRCGCKYMDDYKPVLVRTIRQEVKSWKQSQLEKLGKTKSLVLRLICMNPAVVFQDLQEARCIVLASGTLTPMISLQSELATEFPLKSSPKHVIPRDRVWVGSLERFTDERGREYPFKCTSRHTEMNYLQDALGAALRRVCEATPHGVLCFFPSYHVMETLVQQWKKTEEWTKLERIKHIFIESNDVKKHRVNMEKFYACVGSERGAVLLAVYRGKVAEGMDFKDHQARAVITIGVPYPNTYDIAVKEKKNYNNRYTHSRNLLPGEEWLHVQAYRALNQAVGRCVRHIADWGAVLLVDERFRIFKYTEHLSPWVRDQLGNNHHSLDSLFSSANGLDAFMRSMKIREHEDLSLSPT